MSMPSLVNNQHRLDPNIWGPHFWFFLHTLAMSYPHYPNSVTKKKYYELIQNLPVFIPVDSISTDFSKILDEYPVTAYLDSRDALIRWMHFIHNKINEKLEKPKITLNEFYLHYYVYNYAFFQNKMIQ
jgi:FAD-linked sulfhydryl oxidase